MGKHDDRAEMGAAGRQSRRRTATRRRLMQAALELMAAKGVEATTINEITEAADVGFGSFYNHFPSKEAIRNAVVAELVLAFAEQLDRVDGVIDDPLEATCAKMRIVLRKLLDQPDWADFVTRTWLHTEDWHRGFMPRMRADLERVAAAGRADIPDPAAAAVAIAGALVALMSGVRLGRIVLPDLPERGAALAMRLLGVDQAEIDRLLARPLPALAGDRRV